MFDHGGAIPYWRLSSFYFFYFALLGAWLPFWPLYLDDKGFNAADIGYLTGIAMATKIVAPNIWGWIAARSGKRMLVIRGGSLLAVLIFAGIFLLPQSFWYLALIICGFSFFWNAVLAQFEVATLSHLDEHYERYSQIRVWGSIGFILLVSFLGVFFDYFSVALLPWFITAFLLAIWISSLLVNEKRAAQVVEADGKSLWQVVKQPHVAVFLLSCFLLQLSHGPYYTFFSVYLEQHGYSRTVTGLLWSLGVFAEVLVFLVMHRLLQRFSLRQIILASLLLGVIRWLLIGYFVDSLLLLLVAQCMHAATFGSFHAFAIELVRRAFGGELRGQGMALYSGLSFGAGGAAGAVISGWLWEASSTLAFVVAAAACGVAFLLTFAVRHKDLQS